MVAKQISSEAWRKNFRSLVLLALLGVCAAVAWVLAWHKGGPARNAQEILAAIRRNGIKSYWSGNTPHQKWFLIYKSGKIAGWEMEYRRTGSSGTVGGVVRQEAQPQGQVRLKTQWRLTNNAEKGEYQSQYVSLHPRQVHAGEARIELKDHRLEVKQNINGKGFVSSTPAPENYLPEGLMRIAMREVAQRQTSARFEMVQDGQPPAQPTGAQTPLFSFELRYVGKDSKTGGAMVEKYFDASHSWVTVLDDQGNLLLRYQGGEKWVPADRQEVVQRFPEAMEYVIEDETVEL